MIIFHGGCIGCTQQRYNGVDFCFDCCYFNADWKKPDLSSKAPSDADLARLAVVARRRNTSILFLVIGWILQAVCFLAFLGVTLNANATTIELAQSFFLFITASSLIQLICVKR